ncbi:toll-like receptor 13 [Engraulis encrasicolus]|uniref:toll-like receptor 13 n=1 Tax=Engraulis encrasicolus TaxID=184585 RepID=UPI002FD6A62A
MSSTLHRSLSAPLCITLYIIAYASHVNGYTFGECHLHEPEHNQTKFFCYRRQLKDVPQNLPPVITEIDISHNNIKAIKSDDFRNLVHLEILNVSHNIISCVEKGAFRNLTSLTELNLNRNHLTQIKDEFFSGLINLKVLLMNFNNVLTIAPSALSVFSKLERVQLSGNNLRNITSVQPIFQIETLKELHIASNKIVHFQSTDISNSSLQLQMLNLSSNPISVFRITANIFPNLTAIDLSFCFLKPNFEWVVLLSTEFFRNVRRLDLNGVNISFVDFNTILQTFNKSLVQLKLSNVHSVKAFIRKACLIPTLTELKLGQNNITNFTETGLDKCTHLRSLNLNRNNLTKLENLFTSLKHVSNLDLSQNDFSDIPSIIQNLSMLKSLNIVFNNIKIINCSTFENVNLKMLKLYHNSISEINDCVFQNMTDLKELLLGSNSIESLRGAFKNGPAKLRYLEISANALHSIKEDDFRGLTSLTELFLNDNKIESIDSGAFDSLISLKTLNLQANKITDKYLTPAIFSGLPNLYELFLQNNHLFTSKRYKTPPFSHLKAFHILSVVSQPHHKSQTYLPVNLLWNLTTLKGFWAQKVGFTFLNDDFFKDNNELTDLALSENHLAFLSPNTFLPLRNLKNLQLENCNLKTLDFIVKANLLLLSRLQIKNNQISSINNTVINALPALNLLEMRGNPFICDCSNKDFIKWVETDNFTQVLEANTFRCNSPPNLIGTHLLNLDVHSCSVDWGFYCYISTASVVLLTMVTSLLYHFLRWQIVYAYYLFLAFLYDKKKKDPKKARFQYDAFVSYNLHDEHWVTGTLLPKLEGEQGWRLCLHHRDFQPGKFIMDNIIDGIYGSRKTICVISQHYLESEWCSREVQVASFRLFDEKKDVLILVFLEDIPEYRLSAHYRIRSLVRKRTYLRWPKAGEDTRAFWEKLRLALGTQQDPE